MAQPNFGSAIPKLSNRVNDTECKVSGILYWTLKLSQLVGVAPVRFTNMNRRKIAKMAPRLRFICYGLVAFQCIAFVFWVSEAQYGNRSHSPTTWIFTLIELASGLAPFVMAYGIQERLSNLIHCWDRLQKLKSSIGNSKTVSVEWKRNCMFAFLAILMAERSAQMYIFAGFHVGSAASSLKHLTILCLILQFSYTVMEICIILNLLNNVLERMLRQHESNLMQANNVVSDVPTYKRIQQLSTMYSSACAVAETLSGCTELPIMFIIVAGFIHFLLMSYMIVVGQSSHWIYGLLWIVSSMSWLVSITEPCHLIQVEVNHMKLLTCKFISKSTNERIFTELQNFSLNMLANKIEFVPFGICLLSRSLIVSIIAVTLTYLVVIMQFQHSN